MSPKFCIVSFHQSARNQISTLTKASKQNEKIKVVFASDFFPKMNAEFTRIKIKEGEK